MPDPEVLETTAFAEQESAIRGWRVEPWLADGPKRHHKTLTDGDLRSCYHGEPLESARPATTLSACTGYGVPPRNSVVQNFPSCKLAF